MKRTILLWALCCVLLLSSVAPVWAVSAADGATYETTVTRLWGDVDGDSALTSTDARLILQYVAEKINGEELTGELADVDGDGEVTTTDARLVLQYAVEKIDAFPAGAEKTDAYKIVLFTHGLEITPDSDSANGQPAWEVVPGSQLFVYENGTKTEKNVTWSSDNAEQITIEEDGTISAVTPGKRAILTAEIENGVSLQIVVYTRTTGLIIEPEIFQVLQSNGETYNQRPVEKTIRVLLANTQTVQLAYMQFLVDYADQADWETSDPLVATVDDKGCITLHAAGTVMIAAGYNGASDFVYLIVE